MGIHEKHTGPQSEDQEQADQDQTGLPGFFQLGAAVAALDVVQHKLTAAAGTAADLFFHGDHPPFLSSISDISSRHKLWYTGEKEGWP